MEVNMLLPSYLGEVIAASTMSFTAQCFNGASSDAVAEIPEPPAFGSFVRIGSAPAPQGNDDFAPLHDDEDPFESPPASNLKGSSGGDQKPTALYGVVVHAETGALEAGRSLTAFGLDEDELRQSQPQIYELLTTRFSAVLIAHAGADGLIRPYLPPRPPRPHARVWPVSRAEVRALTARLDYLRSLMAGGGAAGGGGGASYPPDELVAAMLRKAYVDAHFGEDEFLVRVGRALAALLPVEYDRLRSIIDRIAS